MSIDGTASTSPSEIIVNGSTLETPLQEVLGINVQPGAMLGYQDCKTIYLWHPLGAKVAEKPVRAAQSQPRKISVPDGPEELCREKFLDEWDKIGADKAIFAGRTLSRVYGISTMALKEKDQDAEEAIDWKQLWKKEITWTVFDPLNTAGSLVLNQDPLAFDFQHAQEVRVNGTTFHRSRTRVIMNEFPIYISYTGSSFGFVGRSAYQRALFPLKSFIQTMIANDLVAVKAGVIVAKRESPGSIVTNAMQRVFSIGRSMVQQARTGSVLNIGVTESIETLNFQNLEGPLKSSRHDIIENIASAVPMPAKMLTEESFASGLADGTEDAREIARFVEAERKEMKPLYDFADQVCMHRAWNPEWYKEVVQKQFPEKYGNVTYEAAFYAWKNSFTAEWPSLLIEPESEQVKVAEVKFTALIATVQLLAPMLKGEELAECIQWLADNMNEMKLLFGSPLILDTAAIAAYVEEKEDDLIDGGGEDEDDQPAPNGKPKTLTKADSARHAIDDFRRAAQRVASLNEERKQRLRKRAA